jgi:hypothetical protein
MLHNVSLYYMNIKERQPSVLTIFMNDSPLHHLLSYPTNAPSAHELWAAHPTRINELSEDEAAYVTSIATESMTALTNLLMQQGVGSSVRNNEHFASSFVFAFDKGVEIVYKMKVEPDEDTNVNEDDLFSAAGEQVPESLQLKVTPVIPIVEMVFQETIDFAEQHAATVLDTEDLYRSILTGGMLLGVEFCLRQELYE